MMPDSPEISAWNICWFEGWDDISAANRQILDSVNVIASPVNGKFVYFITNQLQAYT